MRNPLQPKVKCAQLAARQHGVFSVDQARSVGLSKSAVKRLKDRGEIRRCMQGVYAWASSKPSWRQRLMAAALKTGGVVSHRAAARLFGFAGMKEEVVEVLVTERGKRAPGGVVIHQTSN